MTNPIPSNSNLETTECFSTTNEHRQYTGMPLRLPSPAARVPQHNDPAVKEAIFLGFLIPTFCTQQYPQFPFLSEVILRIQDERRPNITKIFIVIFYHRKSILHQQDSINEEHKNNEKYNSDQRFPPRE